MKNEIPQVQDKNARTFSRLLQFFCNAKRDGVTSPEKLLPFLWAGKSDVGPALRKVKHLNTPYISASGSVYINTDGACRPAANKLEVDPPTSGPNQSLPSFCALVSQANTFERAH